MGLVLMSEHELQRIEVLAQVLDGSLRTATAAHVLDLSQRQVQRLIREVQADGAMAVRHKLRGRPSNNRTSNMKRDYLLSLIRQDYADFSPTLAAEKLTERHGIRVSSETLRKWMIADGIWQSRMVTLFSEERMAKIAQKIVFMEPIEQAVLAEIEEAIQSELLSTSTRGRGAGTQQALADIFNKMARRIIETLSGSLACSAPDEFNAIEHKMFTFDDLARFDAAALQRIIRSCEKRTLHLAPRGAGKDVRDSFLDAMTQLSRDMIQAEMDNMGQVKARDAREPQTQIIDLVNDLVRQEVIRLPSEDDEML